MVLARMFARGDPVAALKAGAVTALMYGALYATPEDVKLRWARWATEDEDAPYELAALGATLILLLTLFAWRAEIWRALTFRSFPRVSKHHTGCVLWLHGLGDCGSGFEWLRHELKLRHVFIALPDAELMTVAAASGGKKRAWLNLSKMPVTLDEPDYPDALDAAVAKVHGWIDEQAAMGIPHERIILGGFSQGAAVAAWAAATCKHKLGGVVLWSGYAPRAVALEAALASGANASGCPFIAAHGDMDNKIELACGKRLADALQTAKVELRSRKVYQGLGHGCTSEQLEQFKAFVAERLGSGEAARAVAKEVTKEAKKRSKKAD